MRVPKTGALIFTFASFLGALYSFFRNFRQVAATRHSAENKLRFFSLALHPFFRNFADVILDKR